jgi:hypothetical protein
VPDLRALLDASATDLRPSAVPSYDDAVVPRVRRRRRQRLAAGAAAVAVLGSGAGLLLVADQPNGLAPERVAATPPEGSVEEPRPFAVPTTPATEDLRVVRPTALLEPVAPASSVAWDLVRVWDGERRLAVQVSGDCDRTDELRVVETEAFVVVQALDVDGPSDTLCAVTTRWAVVLDAPLGARPLLHAKVDRAPTALAALFDAVGPHPGTPWQRGPQAVPTSELTLFHGPEHCGWQDAALLGGPALDPLVSGRVALWVRDPRGVVSADLRAAFRARAELPADAAFTGFSWRTAQLWVAASDEGRFVYLVNARDPADVERWPAMPTGCL